MILISEGAQFTPATLQTFKLIVRFEEERAHWSKLIVGWGYSKISFHFCTYCRIFSEGVKDSTIGIVSNNGIVVRINHIGLDLFGHNDLLVVGFIGLCHVSIAGLIGHISLVGLGGFSGISGLVGQLSLVIQTFKLIVRFKEERAPSSKLIVGCGYSEISFHFCEDCRIFREGVKDSTIGIVSYNGIVGRIDHIGLDLFGHNGLLGVSFIGLGFVGFIGLCLVSIAGLIGHISFVGLGGFSGISGLVGQISLFSLIGLIGLIGLISLGGLGITSLLSSSALSAHRLIGLVGFSICSLATIAAAAIILSVAVASQAAEATILTSATKISDMAFYYFASSSLVPPALTPIDAAPHTAARTKKKRKKTTPLWLLLRPQPMTQ